MTLLYLIIAGLIGNGLHGYLIYSQRHERKWSISLHAAKNNQAHVIYILGHLLAGIFFILFAKSFFLDQLGSQFLFVLSILGVGMEWLQAVVPDRGKYSPFHNLFAFSMASAMTAMLFGLWFTQSLNYIASIFTLASGIFLLVSILIGIRYHGREELWKLQFADIIVFFFALIFYYICYS